MKKILRIVMFTFGSIIFLLLVLFLVLMFKSPGKVRPFLNADGKTEPGSIAVIEKVKINGIDQGIIIRGRDTTKPVLLYLHGGPGSPEFPFIRHFNSKIEDIFLVCYWDQRGAGLSYFENIPPESMTLSQFVDDAAEVTRYLIKKFHREKIYLLGHSWGSMLGSYTINKYPELYYAFISAGQVAKQDRSEIISYNFALSRAREVKDKKAIKVLETMGPPPYSDPDKSLKNLMKERKYVARYGGSIKQGNFYLKAMEALFNCREYSVKDKINYIKGMGISLKQLWDPVMKSDLFRDIPSQKIPVFIIQGTSDYQTAYFVAKEYFDSLRAPEKRFFPFENSAHSPNFEEPSKFEEILKGILIDQQKH